MDRLSLKQKDALRALQTLEEILKEPFSIIVRDAAIQRFEYTFEAIWKYLKLYLEEKEGVKALSPKQCFRELFSVGKISQTECEALLEITDYRNETSHTYQVAVADHIFQTLPTTLTTFKDVLSRLTT